MCSSLSVEAANKKSGHATGGTSAFLFRSPLSTVHFLIVLLENLGQATVGIYNTATVNPSCSGVSSVIRLSNEEGGRNIGKRETKCATSYFVQQ